MNTRMIVAVILAIGFSTAVTQAVTLTPDEFIHVSLDGDRNSAGTVNAGGVGSSTYFVRERQNTTQQALRIASFISFDLSQLDHPGLQSVLFSADFDSRLNTINNMNVEVGRVDDDGINGDTWDSTLAIGTVPLFEWGINSADAQVLMGNVHTETLGDTFTVDVTSIVQSWLNGTNADNGFVLYATPPAFQGAGFENVQLIATIIPEPATGTLALLGLAGLMRRRQRTA